MTTKMANDLIQQPTPAALDPVTCYAALCAHVAQMAPHQRERRGGQLLVQARDEIGRLSAGLLRLQVMIAGYHLAHRMETGEELLREIQETLKPHNDQAEPPRK